MKPFLLSGIAIILFAVCIRINRLSFQSGSAIKERQKEVQIKKQFSFGCSPDFTLLNLEENANQIPLLEGWGSYRMPVTSADDSARIYFEQGINMYYAFHIIESLASFEKAVMLDNNFAMGYWGKALALGPNINDMGYAASPDASTAMQKAKDLSSQCTSIEKALIDAIQVRYSADTTQTREYLNQRYADEMKEIFRRYPESADAGALYADALMIQHPWDLYDKFSKPKPWTPEIVNVLEAVLKKTADHPGAAHYYVHAIEGSDHPETALPVANRLGAMMPGVAHLVHMPSHIYIRSGYYNQGVIVNEQSVKSYYNYLDIYPPESGNPFLYLVHNLHMQATCANMDGRFIESLKTSVDCKNSLDSTWLDAGGFFGYLSQYVDMTPYFTLIRFGKWEDILKTDQAPESRVYANLIWQYGQGLAYARKHAFSKADAALSKLRDYMSSPQLQESPPAFNPGIASARVAEKILQGVIAEEQGDLDMAIDLLKDAVNREDEMIYNEPKDWPHPARQYLGNTLLKAKKYQEAEKIFTEDLKINPNNGWSLTGLSVALQMQGKKSAAKTIKAKAVKSFERSDMLIKTSVF